MLFCIKKTYPKGKEKHDQILNTNHELDIKYLTRSQGLYSSRFLFSDHKDMG